MKQHTIHTPYLVGDVHFYSTEINGELVLFDTGPPTLEGLDFLQSQVDLNRLKHVFITHCHGDHCGLAAFLSENFDAAIYLPQKDDLRLRKQVERDDQQLALLVSYGFGKDILNAVYEEVQRHQDFSMLTDGYKIVKDSEIPQRLGISLLSCPGHCQSDLVYMHDGYAITGDTLLRGIFQVPLLDVDLETITGERFRNYAAYCSSLVKLSRLRNYKILPGHRSYVESVDETILFYVNKLMDRAAKVDPYYRAGKSVYETLRTLFGEPEENPLMAYLKASEVIFLYDFLANPSLLTNALKEAELQRCFEPTDAALVAG